jgi:hypothetical protein
MPQDTAESPDFCGGALPLVAGTQFGSCIIASRSRDMTSGDAEPVLFTPRQRDRRQAIGELLSALTRSLDRRLDVSLMRGAFEETLRRIVPVRSVQLRDMGSRWSRRADGSGIESIALEVPAADSSMAGLLDATFDPGCRLGEWDFQMLGLASHVAALVLEIERLRLQLARAGLLALNRPRRDGAAPLIGSTPLMHALRSAIERVAATDFTVLLEGPTDPQQKAKDGAFL